jgi:hypothetical protein
MTRTTYLAQIAEWPLLARQAFGELFVALLPPGMEGWQEIERRAYEDTLARLHWGDFAPVPQPAPEPEPTQTVMKPLNPRKGRRR